MTFQIDYLKLAALAKTMIDGAGRPVTFVKLNRTPTDPAKPWRGNVDPRGAPAATLTANAVFVEPSSATKLGMSTTTSDLLKKSKAILLVATDTELEGYEEVIDGTSRKRILAVEKLKPGSTTLLYFVGISA